MSEYIRNNNALNDLERNSPLPAEVNRGVATNGAEHGRDLGTRFGLSLRDLLNVPPVGGNMPANGVNYSVSIRKSLVITYIDSMVYENGRRHRTNYYEHMRAGDNSMLIVRRGQTFDVKLTLDRDYAPQVDAVSLVFRLAGVNRPGIGAGTEVVVPVSTHQQDPRTWFAVPVTYTRKTLLIRVNSPPNCIVGQWTFQVDTKLQTEYNGIEYSSGGSVVILFNAWSEYDQVFMQDNQLRREYVLNDSGYLYRGSYNYYSPMEWIYGQFHRDVLNCVLWLISWKRMISPALRHDAVYVTRQLTAILNSATYGNRGVLHGRWDGEYGDGTSPLDWVSSVDILRQYHDTQQPVKYGQCWVYAGICNTVCRALGIPCRPVTNFESAHGEKSAIKLHRFYDKYGREMTRANNFSLWNYHVWNEIWVTRPDLSTRGEYDGWNAIDATAQEATDDMYRCGPASVKLIKLGQVQYPYDTQFLYGEVNADIWSWQRHRPYQDKLLEIETDKVGILTVTSAIGSHKAIQLTSEYKFPEGSKEERAIYEEALRLTEETKRPVGGRTMHQLYPTNGPVKWIECELVMPKSIMFGTSLHVEVKIHNLSDETLAVKFVTTLAIQSYTGERSRQVKVEENTVDVEAKKEHVQSVEVSLEEYRELYKGEEDVLHATCFASVPDKDYDIVRVGTAIITNSTIHIKVEKTEETRQYMSPSKRILTAAKTAYNSEPQEVLAATESQTGSDAAKDEVSLLAAFRNPLPIKLTGGVFKFTDRKGTTEIKLDRSIEPHEVFTQTIKWKKPGPDELNFTVIAVFSSNEVKHIRGTFTCEVDDI